MLTSRRISLAFGAACLSLCVLASGAIAAAPATVTVRVEGLTETKLPPTQVTTTAVPLVKDGNSEHACAGTSAAGALQLATGGNWSGPWNSEFDQYEIFSIEGELHEFEPGAPANYFWSFWLDEKEASTGACESELQSGDRVLFFPSCFGEACPPSPLPLAVEAPESANVGEPVVVTVKRYGPEGKGSALAGAAVTGGAAPATTDSSGHATLTFCQTGQVTVHVSAPESIRTEAAVGVQAGNGAACATAGGATSSPAGGVAGFKAAATPYKGPFALVANVKDLIDGHVYGRGDAPRLLDGTVLAHSAVSTISLELRRRYRGRCSAYEGARERFLRARCGHGSFFKVSGNGVFSYLLPSALAPGRYVLDVQATDLAGNRTTLARGTSRLVFYVR